jgi:2C-methyl-D-erythritol 2,4-cyclodiphosphate synthase
MDKTLKELLISLVEITKEQQHQINNLSVVVEAAQQRLDSATKAKISRDLQEIYHQSPSRGESGTALLEQLTELLEQLRKS